MFHRNDPKQIGPTDTSAEAQRSPDVVGISLQAARRVLPGDQGLHLSKAALLDQAYTHIESAMRTGWEWCDALTCWEFKLRKKQLAHPPQVGEINTTLLHIDPEPIILLELEARNASSKSQSSAPSSAIPSGECCRLYNTCVVAETCLC